MDGALADAKVRGKFASCGWKSFLLLKVVGSVNSLLSLGDRERPHVGFPLPCIFALHVEYIQWVAMCQVAVQMRITNEG